MGANSSFPESSQQMARAAFSRLSHAYTVSDTDINVREKKKKASKFTTLRKKLTRARRHSRTFDYGKAIRDLTANWSQSDVKSLTQEYEALASLKELAVAANLARPAANSFRQDLAHVFEQKFCTDVDLVYRGACFPAHRALLSIRSPYFRNLLARFPDYGMQVPVHFRTTGVDVTLFAALLRYLYTDSINTEDLKHEHRKVLQKLAEEFGLPNPLEQDMRNLFDNGDYTDAVLVFSCDAADSIDCMTVSEPGPSELSCKSSQHELHCHKAILAARSPFFRNLLLRRARSGEEITDQTLQTPSRIVLDESVIPRRYARVLLNAIYTDTVDLSMILRGSASMCSLSEVQAIVAGKGQMTAVDEAMEVYQIGQFLDFPVLSQGCEDVIVDNICLDNLMNVLNWSSEPHGSQWVHRQALHYLREEFLQVAHSPVLLELTKDYLIEALSSEFLQAGEHDVLTAVLKWGEHQLIKRLEEREPNILSHTTHSISKKGVKKRDLNDLELRDILAEILPLVRMDHVIPNNCDVLNCAVKRGLVSTPPSHMLEDEGGHKNQISAWIRGKSAGMFMRPRLFTPYFEEAKSVRDEQLSQGQDVETGRVRTIQMSSIPDTLYMVDDPLYPQTCFHGNTSSSTVDIIAGTIPVPDTNTLKLMLRREQELQQSKLAQRAYSQSYSDKRAINCQIQLRTVREFGLPDTTIEILQNSQFYYCNEPQNVPRQLHISSSRRYTSPIKRKPSPPLSRRSRLTSPNKPVQCVTPTRSQTSASKEGAISPCSDTNSALSDVMPDIALATSSIDQVRLHEDEFELDIGDGETHHGTMYI